MNNYLSKDVIKQIESKHDVKITYCPEDVYGKVENEAYYAGNEIFIGKYSSKKKEILCLFHELGHIISNRRKTNKTYICTLSQECMAWETAIELLTANKELLKLELNLDNYNGEELIFMRKCLKTYYNSEYNELSR
jgi:Zn-dependent peptidase ImmA (M78 family)